jgi:NAD-dependent deacetylase
MARWGQRELSLKDSLPSCPQCAGLARPDVVWFGEALQPQILQEAQHASSSCRTMLVIGTSALVQPAAQLPLIAKSKGAEIIEMNLGPTPLTQHADLSILGPATITLKKWWDGVHGRGQDLLHMQ